MTIDYRALILLCGLPLVGCVVEARAAEPAVRVHPAPTGEETSKAFSVTVEGKEAPVYPAKVAPRDPGRRWKAMDDRKNTADYFDLASFAPFDMRGTVTVVVTCPDAVRSAKVLPASAGIEPVVSGKTVTLTLREPRNLTLEVNGDAVSSLHLFASPIETDAPRPGDKDVLYFGPGIHEVDHLVVGDHQTVYVAAGAVVRCTAKPDEKVGEVRDPNRPRATPSIALRGKHIALRGRGIIDGSRCGTRTRFMLLVDGSDITVEGVVLRDSPAWHLPIRRSERVVVKNVKILGCRAFSDGIDICNSRGVAVEGCFVRTLDDLIVVKTDKGQGAVRGIAVRRCVLWNQVAHALSVGAEISEDIEDVLFTDCDVIHDVGREWTMRIYHCDAAKVSRVRFERIRIEESRKLISVWIGKSVWTRDPERGHIQGVSFKEIEFLGKDAPRVEMIGFDDGHRVEDVTLENVAIGGKSLARSAVETNDFVKNVQVRP